jgi:hypothetical protein
MIIIYFRSHRQHIAFNRLYENKDENSDKGIFVSGYIELNKNSNLTI